MERILLVEDDAQITASLSAFLQSEGFSVETATGETQARQLVEQTAPGLLLVDVQLAEGSGFGVCAYARSRGLPVIFLTASGDESSVVLGLDMGADDYIAKPFRPRELVSRIRSVLRRYGKEKTLVPPCGGAAGGPHGGAEHPLHRSGGGGAAYLRRAVEHGGTGKYSEKLHGARRLMGAGNGTGDSHFHRDHGAG